MGRQRTIDDSNFWRSPKISELTQEDKATLLYLLTSPSSNIVGVYPIVPRVAAAEMGWTVEQLLPVMERLSAKSIVSYDDRSCYVWVRVWWEHNSPQMALAPKLRGRAMAQIADIPASWRSAYLADLSARISLEQRCVLDEYLSTGGLFGDVGYGIDRVSRDDGYPIDRASGTGVVNSNSTNISKAKRSSTATETNNPVVSNSRADVADVELRKIRGLGIRQ